MDCLLSCKLLIAFYYLSHDLEWLLLWKFFLDFQVFFQITIFAVIHDYVETSFRVEDFIKLHDIGVFELIKNSDFVMNCLFEISIFFQCFKIYFFNCYFFFSIVLKPLENFPEGSFTETLVSVVTILSYCFYHSAFFLHF